MSLQSKSLLPLRYARLRVRVKNAPDFTQPKDIGIVERRQAGSQSPAFVKGPFSPRREATLRQFRLNIAQMLDAGA
jgi:phenylpropionate dioxygenase-like ring-hydroxylating dioxygenase large terminal subunit